LKLMKGTRNVGSGRVLRWARRSTFFLAGEFTCELRRAPRRKRAMKSFNWAIFFFAPARFWLSIRVRIEVFLQDHVVVAAVVEDDGLVVDVGGVGADVVKEVPVVRDGNDGAVVAVEKKSSSQWNGIRGSR